jgi:hypothetical protein
MSEKCQKATSASPSLRIAQRAGGVGLRAVGEVAIELGEEGQVWPDSHSAPNSSDVALIHISAARQSNQIKRSPLSGLSRDDMCSTNDPSTRNNVSRA